MIIPMLSIKIEGGVSSVKWGYAQHLQRVSDPDRCQISWQDTSGMMDHNDSSLDCYYWTLRAMRYAADSPLDHAAWCLGETAGRDLNVLDIAVAIP